MSATAVVAPAGLLRSGLCSLLVENGHEVIELGPDAGGSLRQWWEIYGPGVGQTQELLKADKAVCVIENADALPVIGLLRDAASTPLPVVALVPADAVELSVLALGHGATSVAVTTCEPEALLANLRAADHGIASVPLDVARSLTDDGTRSLTDEELSWLQNLAHGSTVAQVARTAGYAERSFYRRLARVYAVLGRTNRTEALLEARRQGLL